MTHVWASSTEAKPQRCQKHVMPTHNLVQAPSRPPCSPVPQWALRPCLGTPSMVAHPSSIPLPPDTYKSLLFCCPLDRSVIGPQQDYPVPWKTAGPSEPQIPQCQFPRVRPRRRGSQVLERHVLFLPGTPRLVGWDVAS